MIRFNGREENLVLIVHGLKECVFQNSLVVELILCICSTINIDLIVEEPLCLLFKVIDP